MTPPDSPSASPVADAPPTEFSAQPQVLAEHDANPDTDSQPQPEPTEPTEAEEIAAMKREAEEWARLNAEEWARGENRATRLGRAAFAIVAGGYLLWAQNKATITTHTDWGKWVQLSVICNALIPLLIANLFFAYGLQRHTLRDWWDAWRHGVPLASFHDHLSDQSLVAWRLGWKWLPLRRLVGLGVLMAALMLPILWFSSRDPAARIFYQNYLPAVSDARSWAWLFGSLILYMVCWEWFFRGFLLFTLAQGVGAPLAIAIQAVMFGFAHAGKPPLELASSFAGGLILGIVCWREKSFVPAFVAHALIHIFWAILVLKF